MNTYLPDYTALFNRANEAVTTALALGAMMIFGGDVIRGFVFAITFGIVIGTYSSLYVAKNIVAWLGVKRDWSKPGAEAGTQFAKAER